MFDLFKSKPILDGFYQTHKIAVENEPYLNIGALLLEYNQHRDSLTLKSRLAPEQLEALLNSAWDIYDRPSCLELLTELLSLPNQHQHQDYVNALLLQRQNVHELAYTVLVAPASLYGCLERNCQSLFEKNGGNFDRIQFDAIGNVSAWDIERSGLIVRYAYNIGWISADESLSGLRALHQLAQANYKTWADYYVAYMKSRTLFYEQRETEYIDYVITLKTLYKSADFFCIKYPLHHPE